MPTFFNVPYYSVSRSTIKYAVLHIFCPFLKHLEGRSHQVFCSFFYVGFIFWWVLVEIWQCWCGWIRLVDISARLIRALHHNRFNMGMNGGGYIGNVLSFPQVLSFNCPFLAVGRLSELKCQTSCVFHKPNFLYVPKRCFQHNKKYFLDINSLLYGRLPS